MTRSQKIEDAFQAARTGDTPNLRILLDADPDLANAENSEGLTLLGFAAHFGHADNVKVLLEYGADVNAVSHSTVAYIPSNTALHACIAGERSEEVIRLLLKHHADAMIFDSNGHTCLHAAAFHDDNIGIIGLLIDHGAQVNAKVDGGKTALTIAVEKDNKQVAAFLRQHGARE